jgi:uncharacterized membrane protein YgcG
MVARGPAAARPRLVTVCYKLDLVRDTRSMHGRWFWAWVLVGFVAALGSVSLGLLVIGPVVVVAAALASRPAMRRSAFGLGTGVGLLFVVVAWIQRTGDGLNPLPWLAAGLVLTAAGLVGDARARRAGTSGAVSAGPGSSGGGWSRAPS